MAKPNRSKRYPTLQSFPFYSSSKLFFDFECNDCTGYEKLEERIDAENVRETLFHSLIR